MDYELEFVGHKEVAGIRVLLTKLQQRSFHQHTDYEVGLVLEGELSLEMNGAAYDLKRGDVFILNSHDIHAYSAELEGALIIGIQVTPSYLRKIKPDFGTVVFEQRLLNGHIDKRIYDDIVDHILYIGLAYFGFDDYFEFEIHARLSKIFYYILTSVHHTMFDAAAYNRVSGKADRMHRVMEYVQKNFQDRISLDDLAKKENVTANYLSHFIKELLGISFQEYLTKIRLDYAHNLIRNTSLTLLDICLETGFSNHKYLNKAFQTEYGMSPKEYRKQYAQNTSSATENNLSNREIIYSHESALHILKKYIQ